MTPANLTSHFRRNVAIVVGVDRYINGIDPLHNAVADARAVGQVLQDVHGYQVTLLLDEQASKERLSQLFLHDLPSSLCDADRVLVYFAGHGTAITHDEVPQGYLLPYGAMPGSPASYLSMSDLHDSLIALPCRHMLLILDCCFAGSFRWSLLKRNLEYSLPPMCRESFERFVSDPAWQVITSAGPDQPAFDALSLRDHRGQLGSHSPFAAAMLAALAGAADVPPVDGLITATELYLYLRNAVEPTDATKGRQTPGLWPLRKHDKGEFLFQVKDQPISLHPAPLLLPTNNPYRGLAPFAEADHGHFHGRGPLIEKLTSAVLYSPLTLLVGASGSGKSSLVCAGLLPALRELSPELRVRGPVRPTATPILAWQRLAAAGMEGPGLIIVDQAEELFSLCMNDLERGEFLRRLVTSDLQVLLILRSDFEPHLIATEFCERERIMRLEMSPLRQDELREMIERPAVERVLYFEPSSLVDRLIADVFLMPGALPLLSFALSELYRMQIQRPRERSLTEADYNRIGGIDGALSCSASAECDALIAKDRQAEGTIRHVLLRMVAAGGPLARRRVTLKELEYDDPQENDRAWQLLNRFCEVRLLVMDQEDGQRCIEPAHDALVTSWERLIRWRNEELDLPLQRLLWTAAYEWERRGRAGGDLWDRSLRLDLLQQELTKYGTWLNRLELEFIRASLARRRRTAQTRWGIGATVFVTLLVLLVFAIKQRDEARDQGHRAQSEARVALSRQLAAQAMRIKEQTPDLAGLLAVQGRLIHDHLETGSALRSVIEQAPLRAATFHGKAQPIAGLTVSNGGELLAACSLADGIFDVYDLRARKLLRSHKLPDNEPLRSVAFSPDLRTLAIGRSGEVVLWNMPEQRVRSKLQGHPGTVTGLRFDKPGTGLLSVDWADGLFRWDLASGRPLDLGRVGRSPAQPNSNNLVDLSADGRFLIHSRKDQLTLWRLESKVGEPIPLPRGTSAIFAVAIDSRGTLAATGHWSGEVLIWDLDAARLRVRLAESTKAVQSLALRPDGALLAAGRQDGSISLYETDVAGTRPLTWAGHTENVTSLVFTPDGRFLVSGAQDGSIMLWDLLWRRPLGVTTQRHTLPIDSFRFSRDSRLLATSSGDGSVRLWDVEQRRLRGEPQWLHKTAVSSVDISPDGSMLASGGDDPTIVVSYVASGKIRQRLAAHRKAVSAVAFDPTGTMLASAGHEGEIALWDVVTLQRRGEPLMGHHSEMSDNIQLDFSPAGKLLASGSRDESVILWDTSTGKQIGAPLKHEAMVSAVRFSSDGRLLAVGCNRQVFLWDLPERRLRPLPLRGHFHMIISLSFTPDSKFLVSADGDTLLMWDLASGQLMGPPMKGTLAEVAPDGRLLAVAQKEQLILQELSIDAVARQACEVANRNLSLSEWQLYVGADPYCLTCPLQPPGAGAPIDASSCVGNPPGEHQ